VALTLKSVSFQLCVVLTLALVEDKAFIRLFDLANTALAIAEVAALVDAMLAEGIRGFIRSGWSTHPSLCRVSAKMGKAGIFASETMVDIVTCCINHLLIRWRRKNDE
jgi:hypothetical protein